ncbi:MAG TPA: NAD(P)-binding domain-containing protein [Vicinamibacterales bacterium]|nr:NAD(P)-binding domain-containing protein [Vicinamibacterales bacterium]
MSGNNKLPVAVIGAGPVGLAAAAHLHEYHQPFIVLEAGSEAGAAVREWGHVRTFSPWRYMVDAAAKGLLESSGWSSPDVDHLPTGHELIDQYVKPLSLHAAIGPHVRYNARVASVGRKDFDKVRTRGRDQQPFEIRLENGGTIEARAVIDASGTWRRPNPAGSGGVAASGESAHRDRIAYGIPDVGGRQRARYAGKRVLVVGSGHSAFNVILDLIALADAEPGTRILWAMRRDNLASVWGGGASDALEARGELGQRAKHAVESGRIQVLTPYRIRSIAMNANALAVAGVIGDKEVRVDADQVIVCTGFRPDLEMLTEVRLSLDPWLECPTSLGPLIDPNEHSCGTVRPHGARELAHPEKDFFVVGMKSYGRAPTFLLATGYEQARSVVAMLSGDIAAAERVELVLPETGVCSTDLSVAGGGCCGGPAPEEANACCVDDAVAKAEGKSGCGCGTSEPALIQIGVRSKA